MKKSKRARATEFTDSARVQIVHRDKAKCIFCEMNYQMAADKDWQMQIKEIMHYIPRSKGGLGIPENAAVGCRYHHNMLDNGHDGHREEMLQMFQGYLRSKHKGWNEEKLIYNKWNFLEEE